MLNLLIHTPSSSLQYSQLSLSSFHLLSSRNWCFIFISKLCRIIWIMLYVKSSHPNSIIFIPSILTTISLSLTHYLSLLLIFYQVGIDGSYSYQNFVGSFASCNMLNLLIHTPSSSLQYSQLSLSLTISLCSSFSVKWASMVHIHIKTS